MYSILQYCLLSSLRSNVNLGDLDGFASRVVRGTGLDPGDGLVEVSSKVLPAHGPLVCESSQRDENEQVIDSAGEDRNPR